MHWQKNETDLSTQSNQAETNAWIQEAVAKPRGDAGIEVATKKRPKKVDSLSGEKAFQALFSRGKRYRCKGVTVLVLANGASAHRVAVVCSRKVGGAVVRNRLRRQLREAIRVVEKGLAGSYDIAIIPSREVVGESYQSLKKSLAEIFTRI